MSPHPLVSSGETQASARECSLCQMSLDACSVAPDNRAALFLSPGMPPNKVKIKASPYCSKWSSLLCTWPRKGYSRHLQWVSQRKVIFSREIHTTKFRQRVERPEIRKNSTLNGIDSTILNTASHLFLPYAFMSLKLHLLYFVFRWQPSQSRKSTQNLLLLPVWWQCK